MLIQNFDQAILRAGTEDKIQVINERFQLRSDLRRGAQHDDVFSATPSALLEAFCCVPTRRVRRYGAPTIRLIRNHRHLIDDTFRPTRTTAAPSSPSCARPNNVPPAAPHEPLRHSRLLLARSSGASSARCSTTWFHAYTVDATPGSGQNVRRFQGARTTRSAFRYPAGSRLRKPELLYIAALYHDIGKGPWRRLTSELGAVDAERFAATTHWTERDTELVVGLVRKSPGDVRRSQRKDISDPEVIQQFARHVGDQEHLDYLLS